MLKKLIAFYSRAYENYVNGQIKNLSVGNTEIVAGIIHELTGADLFKIQQKNPYSMDYNECIAEAHNDQKRDARPTLKYYLNGFDEYDTIYLGFPNYWNTMPMAVFTFLESLDFNGKIIYPFCTHEGSGMGISEKDIKKLCPNAKVEKGLAIKGDSVNWSQKEIQAWLGYLSI